MLYAVGSHARPAQISPAIYSPAAQRSAVRSRAVRRRVHLLQCCVVLRCVPSFEHRAVPGIIRVYVYCSSSLFFFYMMYLIFHGPLFYKMLCTNDQFGVSRSFYYYYYVHSLYVLGGSS